MQPFMHASKQSKVYMCSEEFVSVSASMVGEGEASSASPGWGELGWYHEGGMMWVRCDVFEVDGRWAIY